MKLKRLAALLLALSMAFALAACTSNDPGEASKGPDNSTAVENTPSGGNENEPAPAPADGVKSVEGKTVAFIPKLTGNAFFEVANAGAQEYAKDWGVDPENDTVKYAWHYSQATVTDQNSWQVEGEKIIKEKYPNWENVHPDNYYSEQDAEKSVTIGEAVLADNPDIDLIICNDSTALPGQLQAAENKGMTKAD